VGVGYGNGGFPGSEGMGILWGFPWVFLGMNGMGKLMEIEIQSLATADLSLVTHRVK